MDALIPAFMPVDHTREDLGATRRLNPDAEAPDWGDHQREAPEGRTGHKAQEAPDAGERRADTVLHDFTHGRSQS